MSKNTYVVIGALVVLVIVGGIILSQRKNGPEYNQGTLQGSEPAQPASGVAPVAPTTSQPSQPVPSPSVSQAATVLYTDSGYIPNVLRVSAGTTVTFKNQSSEEMWTASNPHPIHTGYPTTGGCIGSTFDECAGVGKGGTWSFRFDIPGTWGYHNHLDAARTGTIIVE